ncbi:protein phosphatase 1 regulatory subunit [Plakobranchus ocellatus]|uniref:Protein phosphatase 1 regulatory subunit n=1 Tax=Plakobranchus ocellatus TaxID=259542 RepID=A0AAV4D1D9_9GAST|nr:protein phosphatase 1 regulatory subunit [Plakobranchus ocellatus]
MLDIIQMHTENSSHRVPMDFSQYLLSTSPPSTSFEFMGYSSPFSFTHANTNSSSLSNICPIHDSSSGQNLNQRRNGPLKSIIIKSDCSSESDGESTCSDSPQSPGRTQKKVSFADHRGLALAQVRLVKESPDEPPLLNCDVLSSITKGANADISCKPPIKLCFSQPASDYLAFRDKISSNLISLENVILRDYTMEGTIKVKNVTFEKNVFVRISLDEWESFEDVTGTYLPGPGLSYSDPYDTFTFTIDIPPSFDVTKKVQFAVCFEENGKEHWDNNSGNNYCIVSENYESSQPKQLHGPSFNPRWLPEKRTDTWSDFSVWRDMPCENRYY